MRNSWYLDAQSSPGVPEVDVMESCNSQWTSSIHTCQSQVNGSYIGCAGLGELWRALSPLAIFNRAYGPESKVIDTNKVLHVSADFTVSGDSWSMEVILSQAGNASRRQVVSDFKSGHRSDAQA